MKVALLLFGQPRFADKPEVFEAYKRNLFDIHDVEVYSHMWFAPEAEYAASSWSGIREVKVPTDAPTLVQRLYNPVKLVQEEPRPFVLEEPYQYEMLRRFPNFLNTNNLNNTLSQIFSVQSVARLVDAPERYDWIVLGRYDSVLHKWPDLNSLAPDFYVSNVNPPFADMVQLFSPTFLDWTTNAYDDIPNVIDQITYGSPEMFKYATFRKRFNTTTKALDFYAQPMRSY